METVAKLIDLVQKPVVIRTLIVVAVAYLLLNLTCWVLGAVALYAMGKRKNAVPFWPAFIPGGQVWYTLHLAEKPRLARRAEPLLWWFPTVVLAAACAVIWAAYRYLNSNSMTLVLLGIAVVFLLGALGLYVLIRQLEFRGLSRIFKNRMDWSISLIGTVLGIPVQRVLLFLGRETYLK